MGQVGATTDTTSLRRLWHHTTLAHILKWLTKELFNNFPNEIMSFSLFFDAATPLNSTYTKYKSIITYM